MASGVVVRLRLRWMLATVAALGVAAYVWSTAPSGRQLMPGAVLTSATGGFGLSGTVSGLAPGDTSAVLAITAANQFSVPITVTSITVSEPSAPTSCPLSNLTLNGSAFGGSPPAVTVGGLAQVVPANGSATVTVPILLARAAGNGCQNVTFPFSYAGTASYTATTATTLASSANPSLLGSRVTFTATVTATPSAANPPVGSVTFWLCPSGSSCTGAVALGPAVAVNSSGQASLTVSGLPGGSFPVLASFSPSDPTSYTGSKSATVTQVVGFSKPCITTTVSGLTVNAGQSICVSSPGKVTGPVTVNAGGALSLTGAQLSSSLTANGANALLVCGTTVGGSVSASASTGFVMAGDGGDDGHPACAGSTFKGSVSITKNTGGFEVAADKISGSASFTGNTGTGPYWQDASPEIEGNTISGSLSCSGNSPAPTDGGQPNTVSGPRSGQCMAAGF